MNKIKYVIMFFLIHSNLLAIEVIDDCQYVDNNLLDLHFVIEHPIIGTEILINLSCFTKIKRIHCSGIKLNLNMLLNGHLKDGVIKHMKEINIVLKNNKILINDKSDAFIIDLKTNNIFWTKENHTTQSYCKIK